MNRKALSFRNSIKPVSALLQKEYQLNYLESLGFISEAINIPVIRLLENLDKPITQKAIQDLESFNQKLIRDIPVAYILGNKDFYNENYLVNNHVLIPRPDSELLVDLVIEAATKSASKTEALEIGFGSGCLSISIVNNCRSNLTIDALDISKEAFNIAQDNAKSILAKDKSKIKFHVVDMFKYNSTKTYDIIFSNPPYIPLDDYRQLPKSLSYEPKVALTDNSDGLSFYIGLKGIVKRHLNQHGIAFFEIHTPSVAAICRIFDDGSNKIKIHKDLSGRDRVIEIRKLITK